MESYAKKVGHTLLMGLVILAIALLVYLVIPKYQIQSVRVDGDKVMVAKINTLTGKVITNTEVVGKSVFDKYLSD